ncbi:hypothetical protein LOZ64_000785 [Ophidiomyces ophidiicola]|nr:hypothetical protein LOZ64_000785 [Ophidiomyces ophidiicola]KAI2046112.1 hypothetical protein LOZ43_005946 [Ophidiomyces ophidiicola]KAI2140439.1 hypothetical protein LOZ28_002857 [Ophidiomyces ophidiicola]KAI2352710.1 hypothetical protein LOY92_002387 [Ophidiomyces ophidiicola]KAI2439965.1 hypothetical protein LOZ08_004238 [Ophidiomyces ophidiicola]
MDTSQTVATWLSLAATVIGLGSIVTQFRSFIDETDPFYSLRDARHLGRWKLRQLQIPWYRIIKPPPIGPIITASLPDGLCGRRTVFVSRLPLGEPSGRAAWSLVLSVIHASPGFVEQLQQPRFEVTSEKDIGTVSHCTTIGVEPMSIFSDSTWDNLPLQTLVKHKLTTCTVISRTTLIALFCWRVEWPLGEIARVHFGAHDSHSFSKDVYPLKFERRVDKCLQMLAGVVDAAAPISFKCAFPERKPGGSWILRYTIRGFGGAHGGRHLYNMIGGDVKKVDFLFMKAISADPEELRDTTMLYLPSSQGHHDGVILYVPENESTILNKALDFLPWTLLSWSIHRGLRDILTAFAKKRMDLHRGHLADTLRAVVAKYPERLEARGWDSQFVREEMADMAAGAVAAGSGNSGDMVRIVTDIALVMWDGSTAELDRTSFWGYPTSTHSSPVLTSMAVVALIKCFVLKWSNDLDYQMYHNLPLELYLG